MKKFTVAVKLPMSDYSQLLIQASKIGVTPADLASAIVANYVRENPKDTYWVTQDAIEANYGREINNVQNRI